MDKKEIIKNIALRTKGDIYLGVVGAVRTGKSTFIKKMVETLKEGEIPAKPTVNGTPVKKDSPCSYCDYASICRHESNQPEKYIKKLSNEEVFEKMREEIAE